MGYEKNKEIYHHGRSKMTPPPDWAIPDDKVHEWIKEWIDSGFMKDYLDYTLSSSTAPIIYHIPTVLNIISYALSNCEIIIKNFSFNERGTLIQHPDDHDYRINPVMWSAIVGESGDRKSTVMDFGNRVLMEAIKETDLANGAVADLTSPEALIEHMAEHGPVFAIRDELSTLMSGSKRTHMEHMKPLLLLIYDNKPLRRRKVKDTSKWKKARDEEQPVEAYKIAVEKPIEMILGCIPPRVFSKQTSIEDWETGLLPRFTYWPGYLNINAIKLTGQGMNPKMERKLAKRLNRSFISRHKAGLKIIVPWAVHFEIAQWAHDKIYPLQSKVSSAFYSYLKRSSTVAARIAAIIAAAELAPTLRSIQPITVHSHHVDAAIDLLDMINPYLMTLFENTKRDRNGAREEALLQLISGTPDGLTIVDMLARLDDAPNKAVIVKELAALEKDQMVTHKRLPVVKGTAPRLYYAPENKLYVVRRLNKVKSEVEEIQRALNAKRQRERRKKAKAERELEAKKAQESEKMS